MTLPGRRKPNSNSRVYWIWRNMIRRVTDSKNRSYPRYGGRGIGVSSRWTGESGLVQFVDDMGEPPTPKHTIDRINNDGNYEPSNCRWATYHEQSRNYGRNRMYTYNGKTMCLQDWAAAMGMHAMSLTYRLDKGWPIERALSEPKGKRASGKKIKDRMQ